ncbi:MAG: STM4012 family radical SAM protein [Gemmataceae bacterium]
MLTSSSTDPRSWLRQQLRDCAYPGYVYGYPHKMAYRPLNKPRSLREVWAGEDRRNLYCYVHVPFCNQRCSFCNLFTYVPGGVSPTVTYLDTLDREMDAYAEALTPFSFARLYLGGGTPTYLTTAELRRLTAALRSRLGVHADRAHGCIECSPETLDQEKVEALRELGFRRVSLGVQSFVPAELRAVNRRFDFARHAQAIRLLGHARFPEFNLDLIYGLPGQTLASWSRSLAGALDTPATSLFLYPLYVRPMTGLAARSSLDAPPSPTPHEMAAMYDHAVERLAASGFRQVTMRQFRRDSATDAGEYCCARDGMVGLGAGARSYTARLHYSTPWRMAARNIRGVVEQYESHMRTGDTEVTHGFALDDDEGRRRWVILSLLYDGLDRTEFQRAFDQDAGELYADVWSALLDEGCVREEGAAFRLTPRGVRHADVVGQLFFSGRVRGLMASYEYDE